ncbi:2-amino-4-hydroxy-6-hydroxymethyldihydropteridine diphosphokinase [Dyella sp. EPa41]|uniref:2-amino-4-hydroxy-6- hydroxymethyldihydropteridine diphosphokinase n=1 Tax=Dyella sp. EPa41 TaxID=1561194 RepID=UPI00191617D7|nr:2-amino-4-hydroxy-6-hydroxymethyldihydropteridine diphosphokinase [Dyella sp. EPa41]
MTEAYIALGSNLGDARGHVLAAFDALSGLPDTRLEARSHLYLTPPWGVLEQPPFVNAAARIDTMLPPHALLDALLAIERAAGRIRDGERWGPRTLDLDILHMSGFALHDDRLTLPHPRIADRAFVLMPLNDLAPELELPGQGRVAALLAALDTSGLERLP